MLFRIITGNLENQFQDIKLLFTFSITFYIITLVMENKKKFTPNPDLKLLDQVRETLRYYHYARSTEKTYCQWITRYIYFFGKKVHPGLVIIPAKK